MYKLSQTFVKEHNNTWKQHNI